MADQLITGTTLIEDKRSERGEVLSIAGIGFKAFRPHVDEVAYNPSGGGNVQVSAATVTLLANVQLPHGVKITNAVVYGSEATDSWTLYRSPLTSATGEAMATAMINAEDDSITAETVDNNNYKYSIITNAVTAGEHIFGARIKYEY